MENEINIGDKMNCKKCAKQLTCNKKDCNPVSFLKIKNYGIINYINKKEKQDYYQRYL